MEVLYFSAGRSLYEMKKEAQEWIMEERPAPVSFICLAADPSRKGRLYGGTFNEGLWIVKYAVLYNRHSLGYISTYFSSHASYR